MAGVSIPYCPLMSAGNSIEMICQEERCAWYVKNCKMCSVYILAHNVALDIQEKQKNK